jgi:hypothetical protein
VLTLNKGKFLYAMIGERDFYALPYFVPGSVVRVDVRPAAKESLAQDKSGDGPFFLVEHEFGSTCSRLVCLEKDRVLLHCPQRPCAEREVRIGRDARILGAIDAEIRPVAMSQYGRRAKAKPILSGKPQFKPPQGKQTGFQGLLRESRITLGLSFRDASSISRWIAETLSDELYFAAASTLSDYETLSGPPRHVQKILTLCLLYRIGFEQLLRASGFPLDKAGGEAIPDALVPRQPLRRNQDFKIPGGDSAPAPGSFVANLVNQWEEIPLFLRLSLERLAGVKGFSLSDVFWVAGQNAPQHPLLAKAALVAVNRRARKPSPNAGKVLCEQSLHMILRRDGSYLCGRCTLDEGHLVLHGYPGGSANTRQFRNGVDAEVVGKVTAILRRL